MSKSFFRYYQKGFQLLNQNIIIYIASLFITLTSQINVVLFNSGYRVTPWQMAILFILFTIPLTLLSIGFIFTPPILFNNALQKRQITASLIFQTIKKMFRRTIPYYLLLLGLVLLWFGIINPPTHPRLSKEVSTYLSLIPILIYPFFIYFGIYFAVEDRSIVSSVIESIKLAKKNLKFSYTISPLALLNWAYSNYKNILSLWVINIFHLNALSWFCHNWYEYIWITSL